MGTAFLLLLSVTLIAGGVALVWRDLRTRRRAIVVATADSHETRPEVASMDEAPHAPVVSPVDSPTLASRIEMVGAPDSVAAKPVATQRLPPPQWSALQPMISAAIDQVNGVLAGAGLSIAAPGEPSWDEGYYGVDRDVCIHGRTISSLRLALSPAGHLQAIVKARDEMLAPDLNANTSLALRQVNAAAISELLSKCMRPAVSFAARSDTIAKPLGGPALDRISIAALKAGSGALSLAGARLVPLAPPAWEPRHQVHRLPVSIQMFGTDIARMHIDRRENELEVSVGLPDPALVNLGRRERIPLGEVTTHSLAEAIASCAWPAIASYQGAQRQPAVRYHQR